MAWSIDARVPVVLGEAGLAEAGDVLLIEGDCLPEGRIGERFGAAQHPAGCACCVTQSEAGSALNRLFQARARAELPFFRRVVAVTATPEGAQAVRSALQCDKVASARFRLLDD